MKRIVIGLIVSSLCSTAALASEDAKGRPAEVQSLQRLIGRWDGTGVWISNGEKEKLEISWLCSAGANGFAVVCNLDVTGESPYREVELFAFEQATKQVHWMTACTWGQVHDYRGRFDGDVLFAADPSAKPQLRFIGSTKIRIEIPFGENGKDGILELTLFRRIM